eukprot:4904669-Amphidinium_carterae.7
MAVMVCAFHLMIVVNIALVWASLLVRSGRRLIWMRKLCAVEVELATARGSSRLLHWSKSGNSDKTDKIESASQPRSWAAFGKLTPWIDDNRRPKQADSGSRPRSVPAVKRSRADARPTSGSLARRRVSWETWDSTAGSVGQPEDDFEDEVTLEQAEHHIMVGSDEQARLVLDAHELRFARLEQKMTQLVGHKQGGLPNGPPGIPPPSVVSPYLEEPKLEPPIGTGDADMVVPSEGGAEKGS